VGCVIHTLPEGEPVWGVTSLDGHIYVLRKKPTKQIEVYNMINIDSYRLQRCLTVAGRDTICYDMIACGHNRCIYVSGSSHMHRVALPGDEITEWPTDDESRFLSLTVTHNVLVTCPEVRKIKEFTTDGQLIREVVLPEDVCSPVHTVQLSSGELVVSHGDVNDPLHRVCLKGSDGQVVKSYGGPPGAGSQQMRGPVHMAVDGNDSIFVADRNSHRVLLLSPSLTYVREVVSRIQFHWYPRRLSLDVQRRRLYVAENEWNDGEFTAGRVVVLKV